MDEKIFNYWQKVGWDDFDVVFDWYNAGWEEEPDYALSYYEIGWDEPKIVMLWRKHGWDELRSAFEWYLIGWSPSVATKWADYGCTNPYTAYVLYHNYTNDPAEAWEIYYGGKLTEDEEKKLDDEVEKLRNEIELTMRTLKRKIF